MKNMKKREDDQHEFVRACDELKTELKKTRMYKMITRLLDWLAEKIECGKKMYYERRRKFYYLMSKKI